MSSGNVYLTADLQDWAPLTPPARLAVFGDPIAHSLSPEMHNPGLRAAAIGAQYVRLHVRPNELAEALRGLQQNEFTGTNVTIPHKAAIAPLMDELTESAEKIGVVNTVKLEGDRLIGHNTDGPGMQKAIEESFGTPLSGLRVLLLGAGGGAGRAAAVQCTLAGCPQLTLANRTLEKAQSLADELWSYARGAQISVSDMSQQSLADILEETDLIINATSIGMSAGDPVLIDPALLCEWHCVYDMIYAPPKTLLLRDAEAAGAKIANGLSMLLWQGALAFEFWFGVAAPIEAMRKGLHDAVATKGA